MPLNKKGKKIMEKMKEEYGKKKGESVFYAMENSGKLKGVKKSHGGSMKKGYGKARSSGMGLEDESLVPGKGYEYIKDLL
jgi:hypothetical protein